jgi:hypothetical protein
MVKKLALICAVMILFACASNGTVRTELGSSAMPPNFLLTLPRPGVLTIIGVSGPLLKRESEIDAAREDAARKAAMYHGIRASYEARQSMGTGIFGNQVSSSLTMTYDEFLEPYMDKLSFDPNHDVVRNNAVFIRFTYPAAFPGSISYTFTRNLDGSPGWTTRRPQNINGFIVGVGYSARQFRRQNTFIKSYESAVAELVSQLPTQVTITDTIDGSRSTSTMTMLSTGNLSHFTVLEIWVEPNTQAVWTLAIAQGY